MIKQTCLQSVLDLVDFWNASREAHWYSGLHRIRMLHRTCETAADRWDLPSSDESWALVSVWNLVVSSASNQGLIGADSSRVCMFVLFQDASDLRAFGDVLMSPVRLLSLSTSVDCFLISSRVFGSLGADGTFWAFLFPVNELSFVLRWFRRISRVQRSAVLGEELQRALPFWSRSILSAGRYYVPWNPWEWLRQGWSMLYHVQEGHNQESSSQ